MADDPEADYRLITTNIGFRNIAACIRNATALPQLHKLKAKAKESKEHLDSPFEVRYGLSHTLTRAAQNGDEEFLRELGDFLTSYGQESLRVLPPAVSGKEYSKLSPKEKTFRRPSFTTRDVANLVDLVYVFHAPVVCSLLLAYGYAIDLRDPATQAEPTSDESPTTADEDEDDDEE